MLCRTQLLKLAGLVLVLSLPRGLHAQFLGARVDGSRFEHAELQGWPLAKDPSRLKLPREVIPFDGQGPISWLAHEDKTEATASRPGVELFGGDRLPGQVSAYRYGTEQPTDRQDAHLLIKLDNTLVKAPQPTVRVLVQAVKKVIWQPRRVSDYHPSTVYLTEERVLHFRALRWRADGVTLLLNDGGTRNLMFHEIAELHMPRRDPWRVYYEMLAILSPDGADRLMRLGTSQGLVVTGTMARTRFHSGVPLVQPAWCLEPVGFVPDQLTSWRFYATTEVPLSVIEPSRSQQRSPLEGVRGWQVDHNVKAQPLQSEGKIYPTGFGTQAHCELAFDLPTPVRGVQAMVGMDLNAGRGGCGQARIHVNNTKDKPLWQSQILVGSTAAANVGLLPLQGPLHGQKSLILVADAPEAGRPDDADPLNIRSFINWLEPRVLLDAQALRAEVERLVPGSIAAWQGWTVTTIGGGKYRLTDRWEERDPAGPLFRTQVNVEGGALLLSREQDIGPNHNFLVLAVLREQGSEPGWIHVRINGRPAGEFMVPEWDKVDSRWFVPAPFCVPLAAYRGKTVKLEVEYRPAGPKGTVEFRGLALLPSQDLVAWSPVDVVEVKAAAPETAIAVEPEHTIFATNRSSRKPARTDAYTIVADTGLTSISGFRLELLPDPRLPHQGPGRSDGYTFLSEFSVKVAPRDRPEQAEAVVLTAAAVEGDREYPPELAVDGKPDTGWLAVPGRAQAIIFTASPKIAFPAGARLTFTIEHNLGEKRTHASRSPGRFRLQVTGAAQPLPVARPGIVLEAPGRKTLFEDSFDFVQQLDQGGGTAALEKADKHSGTFSLKVTGQRFNPRLLGELRIRRDPGPGEYRYLQFAWKKSGGQAIGLQLAHGNEFGGRPPKTFRYQAGPGKPWNDDALRISDKLPGDWVVVTRDLFADFGEFTLTGLSLDAFDGNHALFDGIRLGKTRQDLDP